MSALITDSVGYDGSVNEAEWADLLAMAGGRQYGVADVGSWAATVGAQDREVRLSPGRGFGYGVRDKTTTEKSLLLPASPAGSIYHLIHVHRDWQANQSTFDAIAGTAVKQIPERAITPAEADDQPLWLARVDAGKSQVQELVDLRVWGGDGGSYARDELVLQYLNRVGTSVRFGNTLATRIINAESNPAWKWFDLTEDTGWVDQARNGGWTWGECKARRIGGIVHFKFVANRAVSWSQNGGLATLLPGFRPDVSLFFISTHSSGMRREFWIEANTGEVRARDDGGGATGVTLNGSFPVAR